jgi:DnaJ family protein C protein 9
VPCPQATYRGSSDERADLLQLYTQFSGDMPRVFDWLMLSRTDLDSHRFRDAIEAAIAAGASMKGASGCVVGW